MKKIIIVFILILGCTSKQYINTEKPKTIILKNLYPTQTYTVATKEILYCPTDMVQIRGNYCSNIEEHICTKFSIDKKRCLEFLEEPVKCIGSEKFVNFCIDIEEFTSVVDSELPIHNVTWTEAQNMCANVGKRLCMDYEWTQACEGPEHLPFPHGYKKGNVCNTDIAINKLVKNKTLIDHTATIDKYPECLSFYGVHNMSGNVDEFVKKSWGSKPDRAGLKGGYFGGSRNMCRPMTHEHNENYSGIQTGFRCCKDIK